MKDLTLFVITTGEETTEECMKALQNQKISGPGGFNIEVIKDVYPMHEAFNQMHKRSKTPYFIQVDADVILKNNAVDTLYRAAKSSSPFVYAACGQLYEEGFGPGGSVRCWKKGIFKIFKFRDVRTVDRDFYKRAVLFGFHRKNIKRTLGIHRPRQSDFLDYLKTKGDVEKWQFLRRPFTRYAEGLYLNLKKDPGKNRYKILGLMLGVITSDKRIKRSKDARVEKERIESLCRILGMDFNRIILREDINMAHFLELIKKSYRNYSPVEKKYLMNGLFKEFFNVPLGRDKLDKAYEVVCA